MIMFTEWSMPTGTMAVFLAKIFELIGLGCNRKYILRIYKTFHQEPSFMTVETDLFIDGWLVDILFNAPMDEFSQFFDVDLFLKYLFGNVVDMHLYFFNFLVDIDHHTADVCQVNVGLGHLEGCAVGFILWTTSTQDNNGVAGFI